MKINVTLTSNPKKKPDQNNLGFGTYFTDHMFIMDYTEGEGWHSARVIPYQDLSLDPAAMVFHYGQEVFEGMKAYKTNDGRVLLFRPDKNFARLNVSNERLCIPRIDESEAFDGLKALIDAVSYTHLVFLRY